MTEVVVHHKRPCYHESRQCSAIKDPERWVEKSRDAVRANKTACSWCFGDGPDVSGSDDMSYFNRLKEAANADD